MSDSTVGVFARELKQTPDVLLEQLRLAGVFKNSVGDALTDSDKQKLLSFFQSSHRSDERKRITLVKKSSIGIRPDGQNGKARTIQVEIRKNPVFVKRSKAVAPIAKLKIERIQAKAFKAFRDFDFALQGHHLLVYGGNGAGKSSLYWLLHTFLQSGQKQANGMAKYFAINNEPENLLNVHATAEERNQAHVTLSLKSNDGSLIEYPISALLHQTKDQPEITKGNLASDFITYRTLFNFYNFSNSKTIDLWPVFEKEILPFLNTTNPAEPNLGKAWHVIQGEYLAVMNAKKAERNKRAVVFDDQVDQFNRYLSESLDSITKEAQKFYSKHFSNNDVEVLTLRLGLHQVASQFDADAPEVTPPRLGFEIKVGLKIIHRPHTFLNEAKLTQLALSVRFGASLIKLRESPLKLLVLDDLLISLDMNNRIPVVDIILGEDFQDYQKIILTHDIGFFKEFRRRIGPAHVDWSFQRFTGNAKGQIALIADRSDVEKARTYLNEQKLDEAANCLRKAAEDMAARLRECYAKFPVEIGEFQTLSKNLGIAKNKLISQLPTHIYDRIQDRFANKAFDQNALDALKTLFVEQELHAFDCLQVIDEVLKTTERVLNPGSHGGDAPLYETEVAKALLLIEKFLANGDILLSTIQNKP